MIPLKNTPQPQPSSAGHPWPQRIQEFTRETGRKNLSLAFALLAFGLAATLIISFYIKKELETAALLEFDFISNEIQLNISDRLDSSAQILYSGAALFDTKGEVTREDWRTFTEMLRVDENLPGTQGVGFSLLIPPDQLDQHLQAVRAEGFPDYTIRPDGPRDIYSSIIYLEPFSGRNLRAFGYDMYSEPVRRAAMDQARDENKAVLSGKVILVQETEENVQAGTLMYVPVYSPDLPADTVEQRRAAIVGWVYSPYRMTDLMQGTLGSWEQKQKDNHIYLEVFDGDVISPDTLLYDSRNETDKLHSSSKDLSKIAKVLFAGHNWTLRITQIGGISSLTEYGSVWLILLGGTSISVLLFGLMISLLRTRVHAQRIARNLTEEIQTSEEKFRQFFEQSSEGVALLDESGRVIEWNRAIEANTGLEREQVLGAEFIDVQSALSPSYIPPEIFERQKAMVNQALQTGEAPFLNRIIESPYKTVDGEIRIVQQMVFPIKTPNGYRLGILSRDVTENLRAKKDLQQQSERLSQLLGFSEEFLQNNSGVEFQKITDQLLAISGGKFAAFNIWDEETCEFQTIAMAGVSQETLQKVNSILGFELISRRWTIKPESDDWIKRENKIKFLSVGQYAGKFIPAPIASILENLLHTGQVIIAQIMIQSKYYGNFAIVMPEGVEFNADDLVNIYTRQIGLLLQRQSAEAALRESEFRFRQMFEKHAAVMLLIDPGSGAIIDANPAAANFYGHPRQQLCRMQISEINALMPDEIAAKRHKAASQERNFIFSHRLANGEQRIVEVHSSPIDFNDRQLLFSIVHDISARFQAEEQLYELTHQLQGTLVTITAGISHVVDRRVEWANSFHDTMFGYEPGSTRGMATLSFYPSLESYEDLGRNAYPQMAQEKTYQIEKEMKRKDGSLFWCSLNGRLVNPQQPGEGSIWMLQDISERKQTELLLNRNRIFLTTLHNATVELLGSHQSGILLQGLVDHASQLLESPSCEILLEQEGELVVAACTMNQAHLLGERSPRGRATVSWQAFDSQQPVLMDQYFAWEGSNPAYSTFKLEAIADIPIISAGRSVGVLALGRTEKDRPYTQQEIQEGLIFSQLAALMLEKNKLYESAVWEVTVRKAAEEAVRTSEEKFRTMVENSSEGIMLFDEQGIVVEWNYALEQITGLSLQEAIGRPIWGIQHQLMPLSSRSREAEEFIKQGTMEMLKTGTSPTFFRAIEYNIDTISGEHRTVLQNAFPVKTALGYRVASIIHDITERKQMELDLFTSQQKLQAILDHTHDAIGVHVNGIWEMCNPAAVLLFGLSADSDLIGYPVLNFIAPYDRERISTYLQDRLAGRGAPENSITRGLRKDGMEFDMEVSVSTFMLEGRLNTLLILRDITASLRSENALRESEARFRHMTDTTPSLVWQAGIDAKCNYFNMTWLEFTGRSMEQELGDGWTEGIHADDLQKRLDSYMNAFQAREIFTVEYRLHHADGTYHWLMDTGVPRFTQDGTFVGYIGSCSDISALKKLEQDLQTQRDFANQIIALMGQGLTVSDNDGLLEFVNPAYASLLGFDPQDLIGKQPSDFTLQEDLEVLLEQRRLRSQGVASTYETRLKRADGQIAPVLITGVPRKPQGDGISYGAIAVITDLTKQKAAENELRAAHDKLAEMLVREQQLSRLDELTGIYNRRHLYELANSHVATAARYEQRLAILMFDVDHFKQVNDNFGHDAGDIVLKTVTNTVCGELRTADRIGRTGGDEFIVLLPMTGIDQAYHAAERIRQAVENTPTRIEDKDIFITLSLGLVELRNQNPPESVEEIFQRADKAMYTAKFSGANRIATLR